MKFSVIICTYNYAHLLPDALRTLAAQTFPDFELLIVDDGSTDHTEEVVRRFAPQFANCTYLPKTHTGTADSRNFGVRAASGSHLAFLDADDLWSPEYLRCMQGVFLDHPQAELVHSDGWNVDATGTILSPIFPPDLPPLCGWIASVQDLVSFFHYVAPSAMMYRKTLYDRIGPFDRRFQWGEDIEWLFRAVLNGAYCVRLDRKLLLYRHHEANLTRHLHRLFEAWLLMYAETLSETVNSPEFEAHARRFTRRWIPGLLARYSAERNREMLRDAIKALDGDRLLEGAYFLTYFGLCPIARWGRRAKRAVRYLSSPRKKIDLTVAPEEIFAMVRDNR